MIRVMIVAKHEEVREGLGMVLRLAGGLEVAAVTGSLESAVRLAGEEHPDVALVDLEMSEGEGYHTLEVLRRNCPTVKLIALTAHDYAAAREAALRAGASMVMVKGLNVSEMVKIIWSATGEKLV